VKATDIPGALEVPWVKTVEFSHLPGVKNHCGATSALNALLYLLTPEKRNTLQLEAAFLKIHKITGNGPILFTPIKKAISAFLPISFHLLSRKSLIESLSEGHLTIICALGGILEAHYVMGIGYAVIDNVDYIHIIDNWTDKTDVFLPLTSVFRAVRLVPQIE
jgi:hypothetical protein